MKHFARTSFLALALALGGCSFVSAEETNALFLRPAAQIGTPTSLSVTPNCFVPSELGLSEYRRGLKLSSTKSGSSFVFKDSFVGKFDIDLFPYSSTNYGSTTYESATHNNPYEDLRSLSLTFLDVGSQASFSIHLVGGGPSNNVTAMASVVTSSGEYGISYYHDSSLLGRTSLANANGEYTFLNGTSFSNMAVHEGSYSSANVQPIHLSFDPSSLQIRGKDYGYSTEKTSDRLIWDLSEETNDGRAMKEVLNPFGDYRVSLAFDEVASEKTANVLLLALNGQSFAMADLANDAGPRIAYENSKTYSKGEKASLAIPKAYDVIDGTDISTIKVAVIDPTGVAVPLYDEKNDTALSLTAGYGDYPLSDGLYFLPSAAGTYSLRLMALDHDNVVGEMTSYSLIVKDNSIPSFSYSLSQHSYPLGSTFLIPECVVSHDGMKYRPKTTLVSPMGQSLSGDSVVLSEEGRYLLSYSYTLGNETYQAQEALFAGAEATSLVENSGAITNYYGVSSFSEDVSGLVVTSKSQNAAIIAKKSVPVSELSSEHCLAKLYANPATSSAEASLLSVKIADKDDPTNFVSVVAAASEEADVSYVRAASNEQTLAGLSDTGDIISTSLGGREIRHSFSASAHYQSLKDSAFEVYFDYPSKQIFTTGGKLVADLDDSAYFSSKFAGFTSSEVVVSAQIGSIEGDSASFLIASLGDYSFENSIAKDSFAPSLAFAYREAPLGVIQRKYPLPSYSSSDNVSSKLVFSAHVYFADQEVSTDGLSFTPSYAGTYRLVYSLSDGAGNTSEKTLKVTIVSALEELSLSVKTPSVTSAYVGSSLGVASYTTAGGSTLVKESITAQGKNKGEVYDASKLFFTPLVPDTYTITYHIEDYLGSSVSSSYEVEVAVSSAPIILGSIPTSRPLVDGVASTFPSLKALDYSADYTKPVEVTPSLSAILSGSETPIQGNTYTPKISTNETPVQIRYTAQGTKGTSHLDFAFLGLNLNDQYGLDMSRYFHGESISKVERSATSVDYHTSSDGASLSFIKDLYSDGFEIDFAIPKDANALSSLDFYLSDAEDESKQVKLSVKKGSSEEVTSPLYINDVFAANIKGDFYGLSSQRLRLAYDNKTETISDNSSLSVAHLKNYLDGSDFAGFSKSISLKIVFQGVTGDSCLRLYQIGNQRFSDLEEDVTAPVVILSDEMARNAKKGSTVSIPSAYCADVFSFSCSVTLDVYSPDGSLLFHSDDPSKASSFVVDEYGQYLVSFTAVDKEGNTLNDTMVVEVSDDVPPMITLAQTPAKSAKVGESVSLPSASVSDNSDGAVELYIFLIDPLGQMSDVTSGSFTPGQAGHYVIRYYAVDAAGNVAMLDYSLEVSL